MNMYKYSQEIVRVDQALFVLVFVFTQLLFLFLFSDCRYYYPNRFRMMV